MSPPPGNIQLSPQEFEALLQRLAQQRLKPNDYELLIQVVQAMGWMSHELEEKKLSIRRLRRLFGIKTESSKNLLKNDEDDPDPEAGSSGSGGVKSGNKKRKGHGRNGTDAYTGAERVVIGHDEFKPGDPCPECPKGRLYELSKPGTFIHVKGQPPLYATIYELQKYRCNLCGEVFTAKLPEGVGEEKYDETAGAMLAMMRYGGGFPHYRLRRFQDNLGIPLPESTQWDIIEKAADTAQYIYKELIRQAAQGDLFHNDDTFMRILSKMKENILNEGKRKGVFTSGILSIKDQLQIALYFTGNQHAGENIRDILRNRGSTLELPIQMCDALSRNLPKEFEVILSNCMVHARRHFVDLLHIFPDKCTHVIKAIRDVYHNDNITKKNNMSWHDRLEYHQKHSKPIMDDLKQWIQQQFDQKNVEPNSSLGKAFNYMIKHWKPLTRFLQVPGCPLDNNIVERCLKSAIMHRKNSLFFRTELGAHVGDIFMSIIQTCRLAKVNAFDYLTHILKHPHKVFKNPGLWMPWNYQASIVYIP